MKRVRQIAGRGHFHRGRTGSSLVEFAVVSMLFFTLVFGVFDFGHVFFVQMTLQHALREAGRYAVTARHEPGTNPKTGSSYTRVESIVKAAERAASGIDIASMDISSASSASGPYVSGGAGGPTDFVRVSLTANVPLYTPLIGQIFGPSGVYTFTVSTVFRNEPFNPKDTV